MARLLFQEKAYSSSDFLLFHQAITTGTKETNIIMRITTEKLFFTNSLLANM